jgi:hypothetical protein
MTDEANMVPRDYVHHFTAADHAQLPDFGLHCLSLPDAAFLAALDQWSAGEAPPGFAGKEWGGDREQPEAQVAIAGLATGIRAKLIEAVNAGRLQAIVFERSWPASDLVPERTYLEVQVFETWLRLHDFGYGNVIDGWREEQQDLLWNIATTIASARAAFRRTSRDPESSGASTEAPATGVPKQAYMEALLHIARLERHRARQGGGDVEKRPNDKQGTLLKLVIGMAIEGYRYDPEAVRSEAPAEIASDLAKQGLNVTDDTVRKWLKAATSAVLPKKPRKS